MLFRLKLTTCAWTDTKSKPAFNFEEETMDAQAALDDIQAQRQKPKQSGRRSLRRRVRMTNC